MCAVSDSFANFFITDHFARTFGRKRNWSVHIFSGESCILRKRGGAIPGTVPRRREKVCSAALRPWAPDLESDGTGYGDGEEG